MNEIREQELYRPERRTRANLAKREQEEMDYPNGCYWWSRAARAWRSLVSYGGVQRLPEVWASLSIYRTEPPPNSIRALVGGDTWMDIAKYAEAVEEAIWLWRAR